MKVQLVTLYRVSHLQRYGVTVHGNVTSVYPPLVEMYVDLIAIYEKKIFIYPAWMRVCSERMPPADSPWNYVA
jgi:hypothetical protein